MPSQFVDPAAQQAIAAAAFNPAAAQASMPQAAMPQAAMPQAAMPQAAMPQAAAAPPMVAPQISMPVMPNPAAPALSANSNFVAVSPATQQMASYYNQTAPFGAPTQAQPIISGPGPAQLIATPMPLASGGAQRLKMIINK